MLIILLSFLTASNALTLIRDKSILYSRTVMIVLMLIFIMMWNNFSVKALHKGIALYGGLFNVTLFTQTINLFIIVMSATILILTSFFPRNISIDEYSSIYKMFFYKFIWNKKYISNIAGQQFRIIEYALIVVFVTCGAVFIVSTGDIISIFLSVELQSYGLYIISTLYRDSESATGSGLMYFLLGGLSSCFILLGSALLYANSGTTNLDNLYVISGITGINDSLILTNWYDSYYLHLSLIILAVGFLFKISAAPFHFWSPVVYDGIPTIVTTFVAIIPKISILSFLLELVYYTECIFFNFSWKNVLLLSSMFSLVIGSVLGLTQFRIKRLLAYSTVNHVGFMLLALSIDSIESIQAYIFYILQYTISNLNVFFALLTIGYTLYFHVSKNKQDEQNLLDQNNSPIQLINQLKGYFYINPFMALSLSATLFSFVGVPPVLGFFAKQMILSAALDNGYTFMSLVAILTSVIGAGYYLNVIKEIFFYKQDYIINPALNLNGDKNTQLLANNSNTKSIFTSNNSLAANTHFTGYVIPKNQYNNSSNIIENKGKQVLFTLENVKINSCLSTSISILTLLLILFIYTPSIWFNIINILTLVLFKA